MHIFAGRRRVFDGYPMNFIPKPVRYRIMPYFLFDEARVDEFPAGFVPTEHTPEAVAERMHGDGAVCAKTTFEGGSAIATTCRYLANGSSGIWWPPRTRAACRCCYTPTPSPPRLSGWRWVSTLSRTHVEMG